MSDFERISHIRSPDGTFRIEQSWRPDDRAPDWQRTCIIAEPSGCVLVDLPLFEVAGEPAFPAPGQVHLTLRHRYGQQVHIALDVAEETFRVVPSEAPKPLAQMPSHLTELIAASTLVPPAPRRGGAGLDLLSAIGGSMLVMGGLLLALIGSNQKDRLMGLVGIAFFGACTVLPMLGLQRGWPRLVPHLPLIAALGEIPWTIFCFVIFLFMIGDAPTAIGRDQVRVMTAAAIVPAMFGLLWALVAGTRSPSLSPAGRTSLTLGGLICSAFIGYFVWQVEG